MKQVMASGEDFKIQTKSGGTVKVPDAENGTTVELAMKELVGETMPEVPTQKQLVDVVKKVFNALGGTVA